MIRSDKTGRMDSIQTPIIPAIGAMIEATPGTISLGQGVVHFAPPPAVATAIEAFWQDPLNHQYGPIEGNEALRACIRAKLAEENGQHVAESQIIVTPGSNMAFLNTVLAFTDPGDEIILPAPYYFNQEMAVRSVGCKPVIVTVGEDHSPDAASIANAISSRTRAWSRYHRTTRRARFILNLGCTTLTGSVRNTVSTTSVTKRMSISSTIRHVTFPRVRLRAVAITLSVCIH
ncbi:MAG: hypothetical protein CM1200mP20_11570 [Pseudomonadota bacterium]|nr:MAG: hypothetical protein CM1200mP20_11570 [Pseudomonadota bacterium]